MGCFQTDFQNSERKRHIEFFHINFLCHPSAPPPGLSQGQTRACPWDKPGFARLPLCKEKTRVWPRFSLNLSQGQTRYFKRAKRPLRTKSWKRHIKVGERPIKRGKRPIKAMVLVGISVGCLMGCFWAPPPWWKTVPLKRPIKRSMIPVAKILSPVARQAPTKRRIGVQKMSVGLTIDTVQNLDV